MTKRFFPWLDSLKLIGSAPPQLRYLPRAIMYNVLVFIQMPFHWLELLIWKRRIERHQIKKAPIFILGYWRSGTTYLQQLLCENERLGYLHQYEALLPLGSRIHGLLLRPIFSFLVRIFNIKHPTHKVLMAADFPSEEDVALCGAAYPYSPMQAHIYTSRAEEILAKQLFSEPNSQESAAFKSMHHYLTKRLSYFQNGKQLILKSPSNTTKIAELLALYPDAKFIYIHRNPTEVYFSKIKLLSNNKVQWLQEMPKEQMKKIFMDTYPKVLAHYEKNKKLIPTNNLIEIAFETFCENPLQQLQHIYKQFEIEGWEENLPKIQQFIAAHHEKSRYYYTEKLPEDVRELIVPNG